MRFSYTFKECDDSDVVILGFPFDSTESYRFGSRFGPNAIRKASLNLDSYLVDLDIDPFESLVISDVGDVEVVQGNVSRSLKALEEKLTKFIGKKFTCILGGEHTLSYVSRLYGCKIIQLDAHADLEDREMCHSSFMRHLSEEIGGEAIIQVGIRCLDKKELEYAKKQNIKQIMAKDILEKGLGFALDSLNLIENENVYLTIDLDVLDSSCSPGVSNPEPFGLNNKDLYLILGEICRKTNVLGFDICELSPPYDLSEITAITAARIALYIFGLHALKR
ncbi:MAG: agmatinase [Candidatus Hydrothermarchaeota archaeon]